MTNDRRPAWLTRILAALAAGMSALPLAASAKAGPPAYAAFFDRVFEPGFRARISDDSIDKSGPFEIAFTIVTPAPLKITSGAIVAGDPFVEIERKAFTQPVPNGAHRVRLAFADARNWGKRLAFARVDFSSAPVVKWKMALMPGQDVKSLKKGEVFGYPVDAGTGSFLDPAVGRFLSQERTAHQDKDTASDSVSEAWIKDGETEGKKSGVSFLLNVETAQGNVVMFTSGWGDGFYTSWFGYDAQGRPAALVTDFNLEEWDKATAQ
jgi:Protein of unknown function (DUF4241)